MQTEQLDNTASPVNWLEALKQLLLWHDWRQTGPLFGLVLMALLDMQSSSIISVLSAAGVVFLMFSISYYCYVWGMRCLLKSKKLTHPYQHYLEQPMAISEEMATHVALLIVHKLNKLLMQLRALLLIEDMLRSLKLMLLLLGLNMIGDFINGMTLLLMVFVSAFTLPKLYLWQRTVINLQLQQLQRCLSLLFCGKSQTFHDNPKQHLLSSKINPKSNDAEKDDWSVMDLGKAEEFANFKYD